MLEKGGCKSRWVRMEMEQERAEGGAKNSPGSVGGWGGHGDGLGCGDIWEAKGCGLGGEQLDQEALGSRQHIWMGKPWVTMRTAGLGAWGQQLDGWPWDGNGNIWNGVTEGTSGGESPGIMDRAAGGAGQGWQWEQLDLALGNSWTGEPSDGHGGSSRREGVALGVTRPSRVPMGLGGLRFPPGHPWSSHGGFFSFRMKLLKLPFVSRRGETAVGWPERGHYGRKKNTLETFNCSVYPEMGSNQPRVNNETGLIVISFH